MLFQYYVYLVCAAVSVVAAVFLLVSLPPQKGGSGAVWLFWCLLSGALTLVANICEILAPSFPLSLAFSALGHAGLVMVPPFWLHYTLSFTGKKISCRSASLLAFIIPALTIVIVATNGLHHLNWSSVTWERIPPFSILHPVHGPWFYIYVGHAYLLIAIGCSLVASDAIVARKYFSRQALVVLGSACLPLMANMIYLFSPMPGLDKDFTPVALCLVALVIAAGIRQFNLLKLMPVTYRTMWDGIPDACFVVDRNEIVLDANASAARMFSITGTSVGQPAAAVMDMQRIRGGGEFSIGTGKNKQWFDIEKQPVAVGANTMTLYSLHDITDRRALYMEKCELVDQLIGAISEIRTLQGIIPICASCKSVRDDTGYWHQVESYVSTHTSAEFSHSLCPDCSRKLYGDLVDIH